MAYATNGELASYLGEQVDTDRADLLLGLASAAADAAARDIGATITRVVDDEILVDGNGDTVLMVPWPVEDVTAVAEVDDDGTETALTGPGSSDLDYRWSKFGELERVGDCWPARLRSVKVTLTHGMDPVPDEIKAVVLEVAESAYSNPSQLRSFNTDGTSVSFNAGGVVLSRSQQERVRNAIR